MTLFDEWITTDLASVRMVALTCLLFFVFLIAATRIFGLRTFAKMSSFDFATTVAIGSILATTVTTSSPPFFQAATALLCLLLLSALSTWLRSHWSAYSRWLDNSPILVMAGSRILHDHLRQTRVSEGELKAKLREANVIHYGQVRAVVVESTGDVSVLHASSAEEKLDLDLLSNVRGVEYLV